MSAELAGRRTAAAAILGDFRRKETASLTLGGATGQDWLALAQRLAWALTDLLEELDRPRARIDGSEAVSGVLPDGSATLSPADLGTALGALSVAASEAGPEMAVRYRALAFRLGDDRG